MDPPPELDTGQTRVNFYHHPPPTPREPRPRRPRGPGATVDCLVPNSLRPEKFGDGITSAVNVSFDVDKKPHPARDRVVITLDGRFLPYDWTAAPR